MLRELAAKAKQKAEHPTKNKILSSELFVSDLPGKVRGFQGLATPKLYLEVFNKDIAPLKAQERSWYSFFTVCIEG
jgi:hypothetical protein